MPERPAPTTSTSRCSIGGSSLLRGRAGELVVQRALLAEQLLPPLLDQSSGVAVVGMEVATVVVAQLLPHRGPQERRTAEPHKAATQAAAAVGVAVHGHRSDHLRGHAQDE